MDRWRGMLEDEQGETKQQGDGQQGGRSQTMVPATGANTGPWGSPWRGQSHTWGEQKMLAVGGHPAVSWDTLSCSAFFLLEGASRSPVVSLWHLLVAVWGIAGFLLEVLSKAGKDLGGKGAASVERRWRVEPEPGAQAWEMPTLPNCSHTHSHTHPCSTPRPRVGEAVMRGQEGCGRPDNVGVWPGELGEIDQREEQGNCRSWT